VKSTRKKTLFPPKLTFELSGLFPQPFRPQLPKEDFRQVQSGETGRSKKIHFLMKRQLLCVQ